MKQKIWMFEKVFERLYFWNARIVFVVAKSTLWFTENDADK